MQRLTLKRRRVVALVPAPARFSDIKFLLGPRRRSAAPIGAAHRLLSRAADARPGALTRSEPLVPNAVGRHEAWRGGRPKPRTSRATIWAWDELCDRDQADDVQGRAVGDSCHSGRPPGLVPRAELRRRCGTSPYPEPLASPLDGKGGHERTGPGAASGSVATQVRPYCSAAQRTAYRPRERVVDGGRPGRLGLRCRRRP
jgi:hypothetical protein